MAAKVPPLKLEVDEDEWFCPKHSYPPRMLSGDKQNSAMETVRQMERSGLIRQSQTTAWSQILLVKKPSGAWRFCVDYRGLNECLKPLGWLIPNIRQLFERIGSKRPKYFAVVDLTQGYYQIELEESSRKYAAFMTPTGAIYEPNRVWMGRKTAGSYFQQMIAHRVLSGLVYDCCEVYIDDVIIFGKTEEEFLTNLDKVFARFKEFNIFLNPDKCVLGVNELEYVGHVLNEHGLSMSEEKIRTVLDFPVPTKIKELRSFLGLANYFRDHVNHHSTIVAPLYELLNSIVDNKHFKWTNEATDAFLAIKKEIQNNPTLFFVDETARVTLHTDASDYGLGGYLFQTVEEQERPIMFISKAFSRPQLRWSTFEKEAYAILYCVKKLDYLLRDIEFDLQTDHRNLLFLKDHSDAKVVRWNLLALAEYNYKLSHIKGHNNIVAGAMSRLLPNPTEAIETEIQQTPVNNVQKRANLLALLQAIHIPADQYKIISSFHNSKVGHFGYEHTVRMLRQHNHDWKYLRSHVKKFIRECPICQKMDPRVREISVARFTTASYEPFARISMDTIGHLPASAEGFQFILVIIDCFTRTIELYPCRGTDAKEAALHLIDFISRYGTPEELVSDRGRQFANAVLAAALVILGVDHILSHANSKEETAIVERANKEVLRFLICTIRSSSRNGSICYR